MYPFFFSTSPFSAGDNNNNNNKKRPYTHTHTHRHRNSFKHSLFFSWRVEPQRTSRTLSRNYLLSFSLPFLLSSLAFFFHSVFFFFFFFLFVHLRSTKNSLAFTSKDLCVTYRCLFLWLYLFFSFSIWPKGKNCLFLFCKTKLPALLLTCYLLSRYQHTRAYAEQLFLFFFFPLNSCLLFLFFFFTFYVTASTVHSYIYIYIYVKRKRAVNVFLSIDWASKRKKKRKEFSLRYLRCILPPIFVFFIYSHDLFFKTALALELLFFFLLLLSCISQLRLLSSRRHALCVFCRINAKVCQAFSFSGFNWRTSHHRLKQRGEKVIHLVSFFFFWKRTSVVLIYSYLRFFFFHYFLSRLQPNLFFFFLDFLLLFTWGYFFFVCVFLFVFPLPSYCLVGSVPFAQLLFFFLSTSFILFQKNSFLASFFLFFFWERN